MGELPSRQFPLTPDFMMSSRPQMNPGEASAYYHSKKALGQLFRAVGTFDMMGAPAALSLIRNQPDVPNSDHATPDVNALFQSTHSEPLLTSRSKFTDTTQSDAVTDHDTLGEVPIHRHSSSSDTADVNSIRAPESPIEPVDPPIVDAVNLHKDLQNGLTPGVDRHSSSDTYDEAFIGAPESLKVKEPADPTIVDAMTLHRDWQNGLTPEHPDGVPILDRGDAVVGPLPDALLEASDAITTPDSLPSPIPFKPYEDMSAMASLDVATEPMEELVVQPYDDIDVMTSDRPAPTSTDIQATVQSLTNEDSAQPMAESVVVSTAPITGSRDRDAEVTSPRRPSRVDVKRDSSSNAGSNTDPDEVPTRMARIDDSDRDDSSSSESDSDSPAPTSPTPDSDGPPPIPFRPASMIMNAEGTVTDLPPTAKRVLSSMSSSGQARDVVPARATTSSVGAVRDLPPHMRSDTSMSIPPVSASASSSASAPYRSMYRTGGSDLGSPTEPGDNDEEEDDDDSSATESSAPPATSYGEYPDALTAALAQALRGVGLEPQANEQQIHYMTGIMEQFMVQLRHVAFDNSTMGGRVGTELSEAECVVGTLLAPSDKWRQRTETMERLAAHTANIVNAVEQEFGSRSGNDDDRQDCVSRVWAAWLACQNVEAFGARAFQLLVAQALLTFAHVA